MIYITGCNGFFGTHLQKKLKEQGKDFVCIPHDKISSIKLQPFDYFYFLSSYGNLSDQTDDDTILKANITDLVSIITQAINFKFKSFVWISTSSVKLPIQTMYSRCKRAGEEILLSIIEKYKLPICIIRPFSVTGVGEQEQHLIPTLIRATINDSVVPFIGEPTHDFIDIDDVIEGIMNLSEHRVRGIYELGSGKKYSNEEVLKIVEKVSGKKIKINEVGCLRRYDNAEWVSSNFKSRSWGWLPKKSLLDSIKEMYDYISQKGGINE